MNLVPLAISVLGISATLGSLTAYYKGSRSKGTIELLQANIDAYKDAEKLKDQRIIYLEGQLVVKDETIKRILANDRKKS